MLNEQVESPQGRFCVLLQRVLRDNFTREQGKWNERWPSCIKSINKDQKGVIKIGRSTSDLLLVYGKGQVIHYQDRS